MLKEKYEHVKTFVKEHKTEVMLGTTLVASVALNVLSLKQTGKAIEIAKEWKATTLRFKDIAERELKLLDICLEIIKVDDELIEMIPDDIAETVVEFIEK